MSGGWCEDCGGARGRGRGRSASRARADTTATDTERIYIYGQRRQLRRLRTACCLLVHAGVDLSQRHTATAVEEATSLFLLTFLYCPLLPIRYQALPLLPRRRNQHTHSRSPPPRRTQSPPLCKGIHTPRAASRSPPPWPTCSTPSPSSSSPSAQVRTHTPVPSIPTFFLSRYSLLTPPPQHSTSPAPAGYTCCRASPPDPSTRAYPPRSARTSRPACTRPTLT